MKEKPQRGPQYRRNILDALRLLASPEAQLDYQRQVPIADAVAELLSQWADDSFWPNDAGLRAMFTDAEWTALLAFDARFESVNRRLPRPYPRTEEFIASPLAQELTDAARAALQLFCE